MATLNTVALLVLGIDYAILLGITGAMLNVIPFIGGIAGVASRSWLLWQEGHGLARRVRSGDLLAIQLADNNFIIPKIVASKVKINALFSIVVVIAGNALWGWPACSSRSRSWRL